jgi:hypothetical protein
MLKRKYTVEQKNLTAFAIYPKLKSGESFQDVLFAASKIHPKARVIGLDNYGIGAGECTVITLDVRDVTFPLIDFFEELIENVDSILNPKQTY